MKILSSSKVNLFLSSLTIFIFFIIPQIGLGDILIVEVQITGETSNNDFVKIYNNSQDLVDVSGYKLRKRSSVGKESSIKVFPQETTIAPHSYFTWSNSKEDFHLKIGAQIWSSATLAKNNSIALLNKEGEIVDALAWGESNNPFVKGNPLPQNPKENQQLKRKIINNVYQNKNDNSSDFYLFPQKENENYSADQYNQNKTSEKLITFRTEQKKENELIPSKEQGTQTQPQENQQKINQKENLSEKSEKIDINTASLHELQKLAGIGPLLAQKIIDARPFYSVDNLTKVQGIGEKKIQDIKKQNLAWVDPNLQAESEKQKNHLIKSEDYKTITEKNLASLSNNFAKRDYQKEKKDLFIFSVAVFGSFLLALGLFLIKNSIENRN